MAAVILNCDTKRLHRWDYRAVVEQVAESGRFLARWHAGSCPDILPGTEAWLLLHGNNDAGSGLIGHGCVMSEPYQGVATREPGGTDWYIAVAFDSLLPLGEQIRPGTLRDALPGDLWDKANGPSLVTLPPSSEPVLQRLWRDYGPTTPDPTEVVAGTSPPGAVSNIQVNRFERDPDARRACLAFHGTSCAACGFSFESTYGGAGTGATAVHHVVPPVMLDSGYQLDPIADLIPLCHNCHAMAHGAYPPRTLSELRSILAAAGHIKGEVVSDLALRAQEDARRILGGGQT
ncbi:HNH endonuclease [Arthrobacter sp. B1I2]|uniref:HNH endonuclease n=1 Tax=Arthrobacter sp. B1I2 TaxID=3042263 RepID=UPI002785E7C8|nr:HNH endonuclease [Arthrobacter sp. B1I2]MDQ0731987.1 5-methylcytosine-specific restriction protein A [Arthrobacter sp. B1I2]